MEHDPSRPFSILERTFEFAVAIVKLCIELEQQRGQSGRVLGAPLLRAGTSIGSMVEEAQAAESRADFHSKMSIGLKEAREVHYRMRVLAAAGVVPSTAIATLLVEADEIRRILGAIIATSKRNTRDVPSARGHTPPSTDS